LAGRLAVDQASRAFGVEPQDPIPHDLQRHAADPGGLGPRRAVVDGGQRQKTASLRGILRLPRRGPQVSGIEINPNCDRHGEPPWFAASNQKTISRGIPRRVTTSETWYKPRSN
jgi:hypothetical protein